MAHPRLSLNQATIRRATLPEALDATARAGIASIGLWREPVADVGLSRAAALVAASGLRVSSVCRGGFFTTPDGAERRRALDDNRAAIEEAAVLARAGAPGSCAVLVLVVGGLPKGSRDLAGARARVADALRELAPEAESAGVTLAVEALHPMYAADRAVVSTLGQAIDLAEDAGESVGVVIDSFHLWWDPRIETEIARAGRLGRIAAYQVSDWVTPLAADALLSRGMMGDGHIDFAPISRAVTAAGWTGDVEVEIFRAEIWDAPAEGVAARVVDAFDRVVAPHID